MFANIWNRIVEWFRDRSERNRLVQSFNQSARYAFIRGEAGTLLKASISKGNPEYRHMFSKLMNTGFRIQALSGRVLSKDEMMDIGESILYNTILVRNLIALGWDTLEVHDDTGCHGCRWRLIDYAQWGGVLHAYNG